MRVQKILGVLGAACFCLLAACEPSPLQEQANQVRDATQREADRVRDESQRKADEVRDKSKHDSAKDEAQANQLEREGERVADRIEEEGELIADDLETIDSYWRDRYASRPYVKEGEEYSKYRDAYVFGYSARLKYRDKTWDDVVTEIQRDWEKVKADARLSWEEAKAAIRDSWDAEYTKR